MATPSISSGQMSPMPYQNVPLSLSVWRPDSYDFEVSLKCTIQPFFTNYSVWVLVAIYCLGLAHT